YELDVRIAVDMARTDDADDGDQHVRNTTDRILHCLELDPVITGVEHRMDGDDGAEVVGGLPERIEVRIVEHAALALWLGADHRPLELLAVGFAQDLRSAGPDLQRHY